MIEATPGLSERLEAVLKLPPLPYQQRTIGWMLARETQEGGAAADYWIKIG